MMVIQDQSILHLQYQRALLRQPIMDKERF